MKWAGAFGGLVGIGSAIYIAWADIRMRRDMKRRAR